VEQFYFYYVTREVYAKLGADAYVAAYPLLAETCQDLSDLGLPLVCPDSTSVNSTEAEEALRNHADAPFSSVSTAGSPLPFWGEGGGFLFDGNLEVGQLAQLSGEEAQHLIHSRRVKKGEIIELQDQRKQHFQVVLEEVTRRELSFQVQKSLPVLPPSALNLEILVA